MISVDEAWAALAAAAPLGKTERVNLSDAAGRVLAEPLTAKRTQPPRNVSAMDGYAISFSDIESGVDTFDIIGEAPAGGLFDGTVKSGQTVRIFTGGSLPDGCDHVIIQEDVAREDDAISISDQQTAPRHVRKAGQDFAQGDVLLPGGHCLSAADLALAATANHADVMVFARPRIAFIASGDEIVPPGNALNDTQIPDSISVALATMVESWGGQSVGSVITPDDKTIFTQAVAALPDADIIVPIGGASVGDYDYSKQVFYDLGYVAEFEKIAVKPGKPCWFAKNDANLVLGLPGNPSSAMVTATLFLRPLIAQLAGFNAPQVWATGLLDAPLDANGARETYLRGSWRIGDDGRIEVSISSRQDSALTSVFAAANCLVQRKADAPALSQGAPVQFLFL